MALLKFLKGLKSNLPSTKIDGQIYYTTDEHKLYVDDNNERNPINAETADKITKTTKFNVTGAATGTAANYNGTQDSVNISLNDVNHTAIQWDSNKQFSAKTSVIGTAMLPRLNANRITNIVPGAIKYEYSNDSGETWTEITYNDATMETALTSLTTNFGANLYIGNKTSGTATIDDQMRITVNATVGSVYCNIRKIFMYVATGGAECKCKIEKSLKSDPTSFIPIKEVYVSGNAGWNEYSFESFLFGGTTGAYELRFTFYIIIMPSTLNESLHARLRLMGLYFMGENSWASPSNWATQGTPFWLNGSTEVAFDMPVVSSKYIRADGGFRGTATAADKDGHGLDIYSNYLRKDSDNTVGRLGSYGVGAEIFNDYTNNKASRGYTHAEGSSTIASGMAAHAEGYTTVASGIFSHAEGNTTTASGAYSHSENYSTTANGGASHAEGQGTIATGTAAHVQGKFNIEDTAKDYIHIVGNGTSSTNRSNAHTIDYAGQAWFAGPVQVGGTGFNSDGAESLTTVNDVKGLISQYGINGDSVYLDISKSLLENHYDSSNMYELKNKLSIQNVNGYLFTITENTNFKINYYIPLGGDPQSIKHPSFISGFYIQISDQGAVGVFVDENESNNLTGYLTGILTPINLYWGE